MSARKERKPSRIKMRVQVVELSLYDRVLELCWDVSRGQTTGVKQEADFLWNKLVRVRTEDAGIEIVE